MVDRVDYKQIRNSIRTVGDGRNLKLCLCRNSFMNTVDGNEMMRMRMAYEINEVCFTFRERFYFFAENYTRASHLTPIKT